MRMSCPTDSDPTHPSKGLKRLTLRAPCVQKTRKESMSEMLSTESGSPVLVLFDSLYTLNALVTLNTLAVLQVHTLLDLLYCHIC